MQDGKTVARRKNRCKTEKPSHFFFPQHAMSPCVPCIVTLVTEKASQTTLIFKNDYMPNSHFEVFFRKKPSCTSQFRCHVGSRAKKTVTCKTEKPSCTSQFRCHVGSRAKKTVLHVPNRHILGGKRQFKNAVDLFAAVSVTFVTRNTELVSPNFQGDSYDETRTYH